jgi:hypothetical protein
MYITNISEAKAHLSALIEKVILIKAKEAIADGGNMER